MPKAFFHSGLIVLCALIVSGCGVQMRSYAQVRERVDQESTGNAGYLMGAPPAGEAADVKRTRKVYVVEFSREDAPEDMTAPAPAPRRSYDYDAYKAPEPPQKERIILPSFEEEPYITEEPMEEPAGPTEAVEYTIQKDDTLQKISKKFYDSYSKWPRIYEANKDKLPDPNRIKPGTVITIPALQ